MKQLPLPFLTCSICNGHPVLNYVNIAGLFSVSTCECSSEYINTSQLKEEQYHNEDLGLTCVHCGEPVSPMKDNNSECFLCESDTHAEHQEWLSDMNDGGE